MMTVLFFVQIRNQPDQFTGNSSIISTIRRDLPPSDNAFCQLDIEVRIRCFFSISFGIRNAQYIFQTVYGTFQSCFIRDLWTAVFLFCFRAGFRHCSIADFVYLIQAALTEILVFPKFGKLIGAGFLGYFFYQAFRCGMQNRLGPHLRQVGTALVRSAENKACQSQNQQDSGKNKQDHGSNPAAGFFFSCW